MFLWHLFKLVDLVSLHVFHILHGLILLKKDVNLLLVLLIRATQLSILLLSLKKLLVDLLELIIVLADQGLNLLFVFLLSILSLLDAAFLSLCQSILQLSNDKLTLIKSGLLILLHPHYDVFQFNCGFRTFLKLVLVSVVLLSLS